MLIKSTFAVITAYLHLGVAEGANDQNNTRYDLFIGKNPVVQSEDMQESAGVLMTNKVGQKYQCSVTDASGPAPNDTADSADGGLEAKRRSMAAVAAGPCILATGLDWWQYEVVCHNIHGIKILPLILHSWFALDGR